MWPRRSWSRRRRRAPPRQTPCASAFQRAACRTPRTSCSAKRVRHVATARVVLPAEPLPCAEQARCSACHRCGQPVWPRTRGQRPCCGIARRAGSQRGRGATLAARAARAGFKVDISERGYFPRVDDEELQFVLFRSQEIRWRPPRRAVRVGALSCSTLTCPLSGPLHTLAGAREAYFLGMPEGPGAVGSSMLCTTAVLLCLRSRYVEDGVLDAGICGRDWIVENEADVVEVRRSLDVQAQRAAQ